MRMTNEAQRRGDTQLARGIYLVSVSIPIVLTIIATISLILVLIK
jgi:hypothetical protein